MAIVLFCDVVDPKSESRDLRDLLREALLHRETAEAVGAIVGDGEDLGHKVLVWDAALAEVEKFLGDRLDQFKNMSRYDKGSKLRSVMRSRLELDKNWKVTGNPAKRLAAPTK
jgi:hypothetical protein